MRPTHIHTGLDALRLATAFQRRWGMFLDLAYITRDGHEVLTEEHEEGIMVEYGPEALVRYYCPSDPRLAPLEGGAK